MEDTSDKKFYIIKKFIGSLEEYKLKYAKYYE